MLSRPELAGAVPRTQDPRRHAQRSPPHGQDAHVPLPPACGRRRGCDSPAAVAFPVSLSLGIEVHAYFTLSEATAQHRKMWPMTSMASVYKDFILRTAMNMSNSVRNQSEGLKK